MGSESMAVNLMVRTASMDLSALCVNTFGRTPSLESLFSELSRTNSGKDFPSKTSSSNENPSRTSSGNEYSLSGANSVFEQLEQSGSMGVSSKRSNLTINTAVGSFFQQISSPSDEVTQDSKFGQQNSSIAVSPTVVSPTTSLFSDLFADVEGKSSAIDIDAHCSRMNNEPSLLCAESRGMFAEPSMVCSEPRGLSTEPSVLCTEPRGPFGPYNPAPSYMLGLSRMRRQDNSEPYSIKLPEPQLPDEFAGKIVTMIRGKYKGKKAFVQRRVNKKYRVQVDGVAWGLEFYPDMFALS